jgi:hypothetical protein
VRLGNLLNLTFGSGLTSLFDEKKRQIRLFKPVLIAAKHLPPTLACGGSSGSALAPSAVALVTA